MLSFNLSERFLSGAEQKVFSNHVQTLGLDDNIWDVFSGMFDSSTRHTKPYVLRAFDGKMLVGAIIIKCTKYGKALFNNKLFAGTLDRLNIPFYLWIRMECCMDTMSNPGFVSETDKVDEVIGDILKYMRKKTLLFIITDYSSNASSYSSFAQLPALPHALINFSKYNEPNDYHAQYKNIKRKTRVSELKGGEYKLVRRKLSDSQRQTLKICFETTAGQSVFYLPYQDLYMKSALHTSGKELPEVLYFIAELNNSIIGYQAALKTGNYLNTLHGAFDRSRKSTYHAYDILFVKMFEFAIENGLQFIDFGAVINQTKQKMVNSKIPMSYYLSSTFSPVQYFFNLLLKRTKIQGKD